MLDDLIRGTATRFGHKDRPSGGYGYKEHKEFVSHVESEGGYYDRQARYENHMRLPVPANHGRPPMPVCNEEYESSHVENFYNKNNNHRLNHQQPPHLNFMPPPPPPGAFPHHNGTMSNGWPGGPNHGMQHHGGNGMQHHGGHGMQHQGGYGMTPYQGSGGPGGSCAVVVKTSERVSNSGGGHHKVGWGSKAL